METWRRYRKNY